MPVTPVNPYSGGRDPILDGDLIRDMFVRNGMSALWYPSRICQCWGELLQKNAQSGSPDPACPDCLGRGFRYSQQIPVDGVLFTNMSRETNWAPGGMTVLGSCMLSVPNLSNLKTLYNQLGLHDIIVCTDFTLESAEMVERGFDTLMYVPVEIFSVNWNGLTYTQGIDFMVSGKKIEWITAGPPADETYMVQMSFQPIYTIINALATLRTYAHLNLPRSWQLQETPDMGEYINPADLV